MSDWKLHTPAGVSDILPEECERKKDVEATLWSVFTAAGYKEVETPSFEFYDCYSGMGGDLSQETLYKFFDDHGRILALRPDFTTSIARMASTKLSEQPMPQRYMYSGNVFRNEQCEGARRREFTQCGIELIGSYSPSADAEVIAAAAEAVLAAGVEDFTIEIGQVAFFNGLVEQAGLDAQMTEKLRERIDSKDSVGIKKIVDGLEMDDEIKRLMTELPYMFGDMGVLEKARVPGLNGVSAAALDNLKRVYELLCLYGFGEYISIDLGMLRNIDYYTGIIFKGYARGLGFPVCGGGRYDNLMGRFGAPAGAVGVSIGVNRLLSVIPEDAAAHARPSRSLIFAEENAEGAGYDLAYNLRVNGCLVEYYIGEGGFNAAEDYAVNTGCGSMLRVFADGRLLIKDLAKNEITETTVNDFLGYYEDDEHEHEHGHDCDCGCHHEH